MANDNMNLTTASLSDLKKLHAKITKEIGKREQKNKADVLRQVEKIAKDAGLSVDEVLGRPKAAAAPAAKRKPAKAARGASKKAGGKAKYANPADSSQTWTGRGRKPTWVITHLDKGGALDALLINKA